MALSITRRPGQSVLVGDALIEFEIVNLKRILLHITAPKEIKITRIDSNEEKDSALQNNKQTSAAKTLA